MKTNKTIKILISLVLLYSLIGFFIIPYFLKPQIIKIINENITKEVFIENLRLNPFTFEINIDEFEIKDKETSLIYFKNLYIDFSIFKTIDKNHIRFEKINLTDAKINIIEDDKGIINLTKLAKEKKEEKNKNTNSSIIDFLILTTNINNATINYTRNSKIDPFSISLNNLNYVFHDLGSFKNIVASQTLSTKINENTTLNMKGGFKLEPFSMYANVSLQNLKPTEFLSYKKSMLNFNLEDKASIDLNFGYQINFNNSLDLKVQNLNLAIKNIDLKQKNSTLAKFENLLVKNLFLEYPKQIIDIESISLEKPFVKAITSKNKEINFTTLINTIEKKEPTKQEENSSPWFFDLKTFNISKAQLEYSDKSNNNEVRLNNLSFNIDNFKVKKEDLKISTITLNEPSIKISNKKEQLNLDIKNLSLVATNLKKEKEKIFLDKIDLKKEALFLTKQLQAEIITKNIDLIIDKIVFENNTLAIKNTKLKEPYISITLPKNTTTNKKEQKDKLTTNTQKENNSKDNLNLDIGPLKIENASFNFEDKNLPIPFKTLVSNLNGNFSEFNSKSSKPTKLNLEGAVDTYGYTKITGLVEHQNIKNLTDINMIFKNITIKNFTSYSGKFLGREIDSGKLNLDLKYNIKSSNLDAKNSIIISDIRFGKEIKSEDAVSLPLELAIALLEDSKGIINLDIPISGDVNDPNFSVGPIIWKAFTNLILKAVSAPFNLLASLLGIQADEIKTIDFEYASSKLLPSEKEALDNLALIMEKRPNIAIKIIPNYTSNDIKALQNSKATLLIEEQMKKVSKGDKYQIAIENLYTSYKNKKELKEIKKEFIINENKKEVFLKDKYLANLKENIALKQTITEDEIKLLTQNRIKTILDYFKTKKVDSSKLIISEEKQSETNKNFTKFDLEITVAKRK
ncbi:DUF748 domain-containing protein [Malaciobacter mytili]|uniref:DUF748 domain-containing protein n=1 Tax=Malaciobacter mytili TaxID=603050 RepID=UPI003A83E8FF